MAVVEEVRLIFTDVVDANSNKFWHGKLNDDNSVYTEWGRVGYDGQSQTKQCGDSLAAKKYFDGKRKEKEKKGYSVQRTVGAAPIKVAAASLVKSSDDETQKLIDYLVQVNVHNITAHTNISFDIASGSFTTPLGILDQSGIDEADKLLSEMVNFVVADQQFQPQFGYLVNNYMRIVPKSVGMKKPEPAALFPNVDAITEQKQIVDALRASLAAMSTKDDGEPIQHKASVKVITDDGGEGAATFKRILAFYNRSKNDRHTSAGLRLRKVYEIRINGMEGSFEKDGAKLGNIMELWHGTQASNLLSILNGGYVVPRSGGSIRVTGRMYGDGVYFSDQSTKSLNYATGYWGGSRGQRTFMILNDVAMGKAYYPSSSFSGGCRSGYDSTFAKAGQSGVMNNEMIVYRTSQIRPRYLCEFGS